MQQQPMPQQAGPGGVPAQEGPPAEGGGGDSVGQLVVDVSKGMGILLEAMNEAPSVPPEAKQQLAGLLEQFQTLMSSLAQGSGGGQAPAPGGAPQAQGAPGAQPMTPANA